MIATPLSRRLSVAISACLLSVISAKGDFPAPGTWKPLHPKPTPNYVNTVAYGNGIWVAAGDFGYLATSSDGRTWTQRESSAPEDWPLDLGTGYELTSAAYGNGRWVISGSDGRLYTSTDGIDWTHQLTDEPTFWENVVHHDGRWIVTGASSEVLLSVGGRAWRSQSIGNSDWIWASAWGNGQWVVVDASGQVFASADTSAWSHQATLPTNSIIDDIHYADGRWVAVSGFGEVFTSSDLSRWTKAWTAPRQAVFEGDPPEPIQLYAVDHADGRWVIAGGVDVEADVGFIATSTDGVTWQPRALAGDDLFVFGIAYGNGRWLAASAGLGGLPYSDNGLDWKADPQFSAEQAPYLYDLEFHDGRFIASGQDGIILQSTDGKTWTSRFIDEREEPDWLTVVHYSERLQRWFLGGDFGRVWSSPDGLTWTSSDPGMRGIEGLAEGDGQLIAAGRNWDLYATSDGNTWQRLTHPNMDNPEGKFEAIHYDNGIWAAVGTAGTVIYSDDGVTWKEATTGSDETLKTIHFGNGRWVTAGDGVSLYWSDNLTEWTRGVVPIEQEIEAPFFRSVTMIDSSWVLTGFPAGRIYASEDGKTWEREPAILYPERGGIHHVERYGSRLIAIGQTPFGGALILESSQATKPHPLTIEESSSGNLFVKWPHEAGPEALEVSTDLKTFSTVTRGIAFLGDRGGFEHHFRKEPPNKYYRLKK